MDWKERLEYNKRVLDNIPISKYMMVWQDINDLMDILSKEYEPCIEDDEILKGDLFSEFDAQDFGQYLNERYKVPIYEEIKYKIGWYLADGIND